MISKALGTEANKAMLWDLLPLMTIGGSYARTDRLSICFIVAESVLRFAAELARKFIGNYALDQAKQFSLAGVRRRRSIKVSQGRLCPDHSQPLKKIGQTPIREAWKIRSQRKPLGLNKL
jgi:hypothetical protein